MAPGVGAVALANPIAADLAVMRTSLWPGLIKALQYNMNRQQDRLRLFESGVVFLQTAEGVQERAMVGGVVVGPVLPRQWGVPSRKADFFDVKGDVEQILALTNRSGEFIFESRPHPSLHPGQSAAIVDRGSGEFVGWLGVLHPELTAILSYLNWRWRRLSLGVFLILPRSPSFRRFAVIWRLSSTNQ